MENSKKWQRAELLSFTIITILNALPFISTRFFPSMDGASHLANSNIINQLVFHGNDLFRQFFMINTEPVPNWTAHLIVSMLTLAMPAFLAEKILVTLLLVATPFAFRNLLQTISPNRTLFSFLVFPFTHSMFFFFGFFNFCMAVLLFLVTLNYWLRHENQAFSARHAFVLGILVALTYFSHIVVFGVLLIVIALKIFTTIIYGLIHRNNSRKILLRQFYFSTLTIFVAAILPIVMFVYFFYSRPGIREITYIGRQELMNFLVSVRPLISFNASIEGKFTTIIFYIFVGLIIIGGIKFLMQAAKRLSKKTPMDNNPDTKLFPQLKFWWLLSSLAVLAFLYFFLPDAYGTASYTNLRIGFFMFLTIILWISTFRLPWYIGLLTAGIGLFVNVMLIRIYNPTIKELGQLASSCNKAAEHVAPNSLVLPVYCMDNWFTGHFVDYLAVDKPVVMVYNYECQSGYFPVIWNEKLRPNYFIGNPATPEKYINFEITKGKASRMLDYVFIVGQYDPKKDWFFSTLHKILTEDFVRVYQADNCSLYQNKLAKIL